MASTHSQKVLKMLNDRLLETYQKYYGNLKVGDMSPQEFLKSYGCIEDRVNDNIAPVQHTSTFSTNNLNSTSSNDSQNIA